MLTQLDYFPSDLLFCSASALHTYLPGPTLVHLRGRRQRPLFISVLLHGNEETGLMAVQELLKQSQSTELPRALSIFFGNISAARKGVRRLEHQPDYNRIWPGGDDISSPEGAMMRQIVDIMATHEVFASVDIHNNTGLNPHYACVNELDNRHLQLATLFSRTVVYFIRPRGVQSQAFAKLCPAVTLECGRPGEIRGLKHATDYLNACLHLSDIPAHPVAEHDIHLFHTVAQVKVNENVTFSFDNPNADILFSDDLDRLNFRELPAGTVMGTVTSDQQGVVTVTDETGIEVTQNYFKIVEGRLTFTRPIMPSMLTLDERVIRQDCLCYLMERLSAGAVSPSPPL
jgi:succinylglutamate desuccinylase